MVEKLKGTILYALTVLIWGSTWLAIEFQLGEVAAEASVAYRFALAACLMWGYCLWKRLPMRYSKADHGFFVVMALCNFGFNYLMLYWAQQYITSAMASIAFSTLLVMNIVNTRIFFGKPIALRIYLGAAMGILGITALFWQELSEFDISSEAIYGLALALIGTLIASFGNMASARNSNKGIGVMQANAWGMLYGSVALFAVAWVNGVPFNFSYSLPYVMSFIYLSVFGTVVAFACYFVLIKDIGPEKASYAIVLFPIVAVILSTLFEDFEWHEHTVLGFVLVLIGNAVVLTPADKVRKYLGRTLKEA